MASNLSKKSPKVSLAKKPSENPKKPQETPAKPNENLPETSENPLSSVAADFKAEIEKSKAMIADADIPQKNKGGRPSKAALAEKQAIEQSQAAAQIETILPKESLKPIVALPFSIAAMQTGFEGFYLNEQEADAIVPSLHEVLKIYAPQVKGEHVAVISLSMAVLSVGLTKYLAYSHYKAEMRKQRQEEAQKQFAPPPAPKQQAAPAFRSPVAGLVQNAQGTA